MHNALAPLKAVSSAYVTVDKLRDTSQPLQLCLDVPALKACSTALSGPQVSRFSGLSKQALGHIKEHGLNAIQSQGSTRANKRYNAANLLGTVTASSHIKKLKQQIKRWKKRGLHCACISLGTGKESYAEAIALALKIRALSEEQDFTLFLNLQRGSVTENIPTVLAMLSACPDLQFNADFSHYILSYRLDQLSHQTLMESLLLMQPIFKRVGYLHLQTASVAEDNRAKQVHLILIDQVFQYFKRQHNKAEVLFFTAIFPPESYEQALALNRLMQKRYAVSPAQDLALPALIQESNNASTVIDINNVADFEQLQHASIQHSKIIRVRLGNYLLSNNRQHQQLIQAFMHHQQQDKRLLLETARNTFTHNLCLTKSLVEAHSNLRLSLCPAQWIIGQQIPPSQLGQLQKNIKSLLPYCDYKPAIYATAQQLFDPYASNTSASPFSPSRGSERAYTRFYKRFIAAK